MRRELTIKQIGWWLINGDTGISSKALAAAYLSEESITGHQGNHDYPHDGSDMMRCAKLYLAAPGVKDALPLLAQRSTVWAAYASCWEELCALAMKQDGSCTARMRELQEETTSAGGGA